MTQIDVREAKAKFSQLVRRALTGEEIVLTRRGAPVAKLVPLRDRGVRRFGVLKGAIKIGPEFFEPLPEEDLETSG